MHRVHHRDVGELQNGLVAELLLQRLEDGVVDPTEAQDEAVGVGQQGPFQRREEVGDLPGLEGLDLVLREAERPARLAVLGEDELAADQPTGPGLAQLPQGAGHLAVGAGVEAEAADGVLEDVGRVGEDGPPVARCSRGGARLGHRVAVAEELLVHR